MLGHRPVPAGARVLRPPPATLVATPRDVEPALPPGVERIAVGDGRVDLGALLEALRARGVRSVLVEGGSEILASFLRERLVDRLTVFVAPTVIGGRTAPALAGGRDLPPDGAVGLALDAVERLDDGVLLTWHVPADGSGRP